jgi:anti-sigma regulatory factor (Ser/Thr protein kinase)
MGPTLTRSIPNQIDALPPLAAAVDEFVQQFQIERDTIDAVQLALDELLTNEILWGQHPDLGTIHVETTVEPTCVRVVIESAGQPFDPRTVPPPDVRLRPEDRREGGLGLYLVQSLVDNFRYDYRAGHNVLEFTVARHTC